MYLCHIRNNFKLYYIMSDFLEVKNLKYPYSNITEHVYNFLHIISSFWLYIALVIILGIFMYFRQTKGTTKMTGG